MRKWVWAPFGRWRHRRRRRESSVCFERIFFFVLVIHICFLFQKMRFARLMLQREKVL